MKKSICIETIFTEVGFYERFEKVAQSGFKDVEFWGWEGKDISKIKELCKKYNLKIASFSGDRDYSPIDETHREGYLAFLKDSIDVAKELECDNLVIHSNALGEGGVVVNHYNDIPTSRKYTNLVGTLIKASILAEKAGVTLVLEALNDKVDHEGNFLKYTEDSAEIVKGIGSKNIKVLYDAYHMQITEGNIIDTLKKYIDVIGYIHIADVPGRHEPGTGEINYENIFKILSDLNYSYTIGFELFPKETSEKAIEAILKL